MIIDPPAAVQSAKRREALTGRTGSQQGKFARRESRPLNYVSCRHLPDVTFPNVDILHVQPVRLGRQLVGLDSCDDAESCTLQTQARSPKTRKEIDRCQFHAD